jgi:hypothetical protein
LWIFLAFSSLTLLKSTYSFPYLASKCVPKAPAVGTMLLSGIMLKMGCIVLFAGNYLSLHLQLKVHVHLHQFRNCRSYIWFHSCFCIKRLKVTRLLLISPRVNCSRDLYHY